MGDDETKRIILARRARFVAAAIASITAAASAEACGGGTGTVDQDAGTTTDGATQPNDDGGTPRPCLEPPLPDAGKDDGSIPQPCLSRPIDDAGS